MGEAGQSRSEGTKRRGKIDKPYKTSKYKDFAEYWQAMKDDPNTDIGKIDQAQPTNTIEPIIDLTAEALSLPRELVELCVDTTFFQLKQWVKRPYGAGSVLINDFGRFTLNKVPINKRIEALIPFLRGPDREIYLDTFKELWRRRQLMISYENIRTSTNRRLIFEKEKHKKN